MATTTEKFDAAVKVVHSMPKDGPFQPSYELKKRFYGLYKQATHGPCHDPQPAFWEPFRRAKWDAWSRLGKMAKEQAMNNYVDDLLKEMMKNKDRDPTEIQNIVETMPITDEVSAFLKAMGPFFVAVNEPLPVPDEERWRFFDEPPPGSGTQEGNGPVNGPVNGDVYASNGDENNQDVLKAKAMNAYRKYIQENNLPAASPIRHASTPSTPTTGLIHNMSDSGDRSNNTDNDNDNDNAGSGDNVGSGDRSLDGSRDVTLSSDTDSESEDFCDTTDQPEGGQPEGGQPEGGQHEGGQSNGDDLDGDVLDGDDLNRDQVPRLLSRQLQPVGGAYDAVHQSGMGSGPDDDQSDWIENGEGSVMSQKRGGGEVTPGGKGHMGREQGSKYGDQRDIPTAGKGRYQDTPGQKQTPQGGQGGASGGRDPTGHRAPAPGGVDVSEQIAVALQRLQCDMGSVLVRLNTLEALALSQAQQSQADRQTSDPEARDVSYREGSTTHCRRPWLLSWLFPRSIPTRAVFFMLVWPLIVNILLALWRRRRSRHLQR